MTRYLVKTETHLVRYTLIDADNEGIAYAVALDFHVNDIADWDEVIGSTTGVWCMPESPDIAGHDAKLLEEASDYYIGGPVKRIEGFPGYVLADEDEEDEDECPACGDPANTPNCDGVTE